MSTLIADMIKKFDAQIAANEAEGAQLRAGRKALVEVQGGALAAIKRRPGKLPRVRCDIKADGIDVPGYVASPNSAEAKDAKLTAFMSS